MNYIQYLQSGHIMDPELAARQAYVESKLRSDVKSKAGAIGIYQITPVALEDYNKANNTSYVPNDLYNDDISMQVRNWYVNRLANAEFINKSGLSDEIKTARILAAYNWGIGNTLRKLNELKARGIDIVTGWDWLKEFPEETQDYVNFILRKQSNSIFRNEPMYWLFKTVRSNIYDKIRNSIKTNK